MIQIKAAEVMPKRLIKLQPHFLTQPQEVPSMAPSPKSLTCTDGSPTAWKRNYKLVNLAFTTTSVARYQKVSCGILGYLGISCGSGTLLKPNVPGNSPGLPSQTRSCSQSTRPKHKTIPKFEQKIPTPHSGWWSPRDKEPELLKNISNLQSSDLCVCTPNHMERMPGCSFHWFGFNWLCSDNLAADFHFDVECCTPTARNWICSDRFNFDSGGGMGPPFLACHAIRHHVQQSYMIVQYGIRSLINSATAIP